MDLKKLFMSNKAVSPVIGVILMVAITVILAAAIGSAVFGQGTAQSAPQANLDIQALNTTGTLGYVKIQHLGGDPINFATESTKVMVSVNGEDSEEILEDDQTDLGIIDVGSVRTFPLRNDETANTILIDSGDTANIKIIDVRTNQLICDRDIRF